MSERGPLYLKQTAHMVLDAFVLAIETAHGNSAITRDDLSAVLDRLKNDPGLDSFFERHYSHLAEIASDAFLDQKRIDNFGRLMAHPLNESFDRGLLDRAILPSYFSFLHMILGDEKEALAEQCYATSRELKSEMGDRFTWNHFYNDPRSVEMVWHVLVKIAQSFARFDIRKDWFITLMQNRPTAVSIASNAFIPQNPNDHEPEEAHPFGENHFYLLMADLFDSLHHLTTAQEIRFRSLFGKSSIELVGPFLRHIDASPHSKG